jgi:hypothetical protein
MRRHIVRWASATALLVALAAPLVAWAVDGLNTAASIAQLVSVPLAVIGLFGVNLRTLLQDRRQPRDWSVFAPVVVVIVGASWAAGVYFAGTATPAVTASASACSTSSQVPPATTLQTSWSDSFDKPTLDPEKWRPVPDPEVTFVSNGMLTVDSAAVRGVPQYRKRIDPILPGWPICSVTASLSATEGSGGAGGLTLFVQQQSGRTTGLGFGPTPSGPGMEPYICHLAAGCPSYEAYAHEGGALFGSERPETVTIIHNGSNLEIRAAGLVTPADPDPTAIVAVWLNYDAEPGDTWTASIDDLRLTRAPS